MSEQSDEQVPVEGEVEVHEDVDQPADPQEVLEESPEESSEESPEEPSEAEAGDEATDVEQADDAGSEEQDSDEQDSGEETPDGPLEAFRAELWAKPGDWFVVHTYSGMENRVKSNLENRIISLNMEDYIHEIVVP
ncbi:transcription termination/antitermination NusG family protein, partial [Nocardioides sp.]|uniref:transcription termination/antitermination NusG family protein n=1 Tax=Nocardioides sp. TaxID=35761 RepID=UPI0035692EC6